MACDRRIGGYGRNRFYIKRMDLRRKKDAQKLITYIERVQPMEAEVTAIERKTEKKNPPLLYNLAELQNDCSQYV